MHSILDAKEGSSLSVSFKRGITVFINSLILFPL